MSLCSAVGLRHRCSHRAQRPGVPVGWTHPSVTCKGFPFDQASAGQVKAVEGVDCKSHRDHKGQGYSLVLCWWKSPQLPVPHTEVAGSTHVQLLAREWEEREKRRGFLTVKAWPCLCQAVNVPVVQRDTEDDGERHLCYVTAVGGSKGRADII